MRKATHYNLPEEVTPAPLIRFRILAGFKPATASVAFLAFAGYSGHFGADGNTRVGSPKNNDAAIIEPVS